MARESILKPEARVGKAALSGDDVPHAHVPADGSGRADPHNGFHAVKAEQLVRVNGHGGHAHAAGHDGNALALVQPGVSLHAAHVVDQPRVGQQALRDEPGAERVAGHQDGGRKIARHGADMGRRNMRHGKASPAHVKRLKYKGRIKGATNEYSIIRRRAGFFLPRTS